jgi:hypothetical protein
MDRFPEAFERFVMDVKVDRLRSYSELLYSFQWWAGGKWRGTARQWRAFNAEAERLGFDVPSFVREEVRESWRSSFYGYEGRQQPVSYRHEVVVVRGNSQDRYRDRKTGRFIKKPE